ncbi:MAG TPA: adenosylmethionine decarboxylase [Candidatus Moranbacteria bacterium]|nr:adenosylmethionine decarboxylase [Candidatus Moranbacteria bacterium]
MKNTWGKPRTKNFVLIRGKHLIIDAYGIKEKKLKNQRAIKKLLGGLPKKFKMRTLRQPAVAKVVSDKYYDWGISGFVMLYESHISLHTWPNEGYVAMDIYSCKDFNDKEIVKYLKKYWSCGKIKVKTILRG